MSSRPAYPGRPASPVEHTPSRRAVLRGLTAGGVGLGLVAGAAGSTMASPALVGAAPRRAAVPHGGEDLPVTTLRAAARQVDVGGHQVPTWVYGEDLPGREIRARLGEAVAVRLHDDLPKDAPGTTVHWHGVRVVNPMDGAPGFTQDPVPVGGRFDYLFTPPDPGTFFYHSHVGTQLDRGLYGPMIVEDPNEPLRYDDEATVVLDDWIDGTGTDPDRVLAHLRSSSHPPRAMHSRLLGGQAGHVDYPYYLLGGRTAQHPHTVRARPGTVLRLRVINAGADTAFRFAVGGHRMTVTHTDGFPIEPVSTDVLLVGMGERYDVLVHCGDGVFPMVGYAEGKGGRAFGLLRTSSGRAPEADVRVDELDHDVLPMGRLHATDDVDLGRPADARSVDLVLSGGHGAMSWSMTAKGDAAEDGSAHERDGGHDMPRVRVERDERVLLRLHNRSSMWHPIHLHGHTFQVRLADRSGDGSDGRGGRAGRSGRPGPRKDTVIVRPGQVVVADLLADNPGEWMLHCHNLFHGESGMMMALGYGPESRSAS